MKKLLTFALVFALTLTLGYGVALAGDLKLSGPHFQFNLIGSPNGIGGDDSNGRAIMVPLNETHVNKNSSFECTLDGDDYFYYEEDVAGQNVAGIDSYTVKGVKLIFTPSTDGTFEIVDRDATDGSAEVKVPQEVGEDSVDGIDVYIRILGKPFACMKIDGVALDADQATTGVWYYSGHVTLNRKPGKSTFENINDLFDVNYCDEWSQDASSNWYCSGSWSEISVFNAVFEQYFWDVQNFGTRNVQVRFYPRTYGD
jgi:hypothetical protein